LGDAIVAARTDLEFWSPTHPFIIIQSQTAIGRCQAKLGKKAEAEEAFQAAIAEAARCRLPFLEMIAHRDYIVHVLDADGQRDSQLAALGSAISCMALAPAEYTAILGSGLDAEVAVAAFAAT
jgi:hypothetical protein